jgi:DNA helicase-2/ATP-dependent DNA helicase PcrA
MSDTPNFSDLISGLNDEQRAVVLACEGPLLVLAGPGSGKTRALTHKIAYLIKEKNISPNSILAVTFTNKAASEMRERITTLLEKYGIGAEIEGYDNDNPYLQHYKKIKGPTWIGTFHSICARILRVDGKHLDIGANFVIYDTDDSTTLIKNILKEMDISSKDMSPSSILFSIARAKSELISPAMFNETAPNSYFYQVAGKIYPLYQKKLKENNALDFNDILSETVKLFKENPEVLAKYQNLFDYVMVDEYQDTNRVQYLLVNMLVETKKNITVVGDVSQSIYSWRGADYRNLTQFQQDYPNAQTMQLAKNYRSTANILNAAKVLIQNNSTHIPIDLYTDNPNGNRITLFEAEHERHEAKYIADLISLNVESISDSPETDPQYNYGEFAVLYRTNAQSRSLEEAFMTNGIPYRIVGGLKFYDRKEIKDVLSYLKVFYNPQDTVSWARCINTPPRGVGPKSLQKLEEVGFDLPTVNEVTNLDWERLVKRAAENCPPLELLDAVLKEFGYLAYLNDGTEESVARIENLKELRVVAKQYESLGQFLENIALIESSNRALEGNSNAVVLMTLHSAKGLEFDYVFMPGMEEGIFPHSRSMADPNELEEERRLCYVGITRARKNLCLTYTRKRTFYGGTGASILSRFIGEIPEELLEFKYS